MAFNLSDRLNVSDVVDITSDQLLICICVDASYSMIQEKRIQHVNNSIRRFIQKIREDIYAVDTVNLCIVTFGGDKPKVIQEFSNVSNVRFTDIRPSGGTPMGEGIKLALNKIAEEKKRLSDAGVVMYKPWLIIMSDDGSDDDVSDVAREVRELLRNRRLKTKCIDLGKGNENGDLAKFTLEGKVETCKALDIDNFFDYLSKSATGLSTCSPDDDDTSFLI